MIKAKITGFLPGGSHVSDGLTEYGWFKTEAETLAWMTRKRSAQ